MKLFVFFLNLIFCFTNLLIAPAQAETVAMPLLAPSVPVAGDFAESDKPKEWQFTGYAGQVISLQITAAFDSYLTLLSEAGQTLAVADDDSTGLAASLTNFTLPAAGMYTVRLASHHRGGAFTLTLRTASVVGSAKASTAELKLGTPLNFTPDPNGTKFYLTLTAKSYLTLDLVKNQGDEADSELVLFGPDGARLAADDGSGGDWNAQIFEYQLPVTGEYTIFTHNADAAAQLTLTAKIAAAPTPPPPIRNGQRLSGWFTTGATRKWEFTGRPGQLVYLRAQSQVLDLQLELRDAAGNVLAASGRRGYKNAFINAFSLPAAGRYLVVVRKIAGIPGRNFYTLSLRTVNPKRS